MSEPVTVRLTISAPNLHLSTELQEPVTKEALEDALDELRYWLTKVQAAANGDLHQPPCRILRSDADSQLCNAVPR